MSFCPHCGEEIKEPVTFCPKCGELLDLDQSERNVLSEHLKHSLDVIKNNPYVLVPKLILTLASAIGGLFFTKLYGIDFLPEIQEAIISGGDLTPYYPLFKIGAAYMVVGTFFDLLFQPFIQHVYLGVSKEEGVDFRKSLSATLARLGEYIVAQLIVISAPLAIVVGMFWTLGNDVGEVNPNIYLGGFFLVFGALVLMYFLVMGTQVMVWEGEKLWASVSIYFKFFQRRFGTFIMLGGLSFITSIVFSYLPLSTYYSFIADTFFNIATIDMYVNYRKIRT